MKSYFQQIIFLFARNFSNLECSTLKTIRVHLVFLISLFDSVFIFLFLLCFLLYYETYCTFYISIRIMIWKMELLLLVFFLLENRKCENLVTELLNKLGFWIKKKNIQVPTKMKSIKLLKGHRNSYIKFFLLYKKRS